jgi:hypothetical protein
MGLVRVEKVSKPWCPQLITTVGTEEHRIRPKSGAENVAGSR